MDKQHPIGDLMTTTMEKLREIAKVDTIIGQPIQAGEVTIIPISRLSVVLLPAAATLPPRPEAGRGQRLRRRQRRGYEPLPGGFPHCEGGLRASYACGAPASTTVDRVVELVPEVIDKVTGFVEKQQEKKGGG